MRVRRDADEQMVLAHVVNRLSNLISVLTVQIFKEDWTRGSTYQILGDSSLMSKFAAGGPSSFRMPMGSAEVTAILNNSSLGYKSPPISPTGTLPYPSVGLNSNPYVGVNTSTVSAKTGSHNVISLNAGKTSIYGTSAMGPEGISMGSPAQYGVNMATSVRTPFVSSSQGNTAIPSKPLAPPGGVSIPPQSACGGGSSSTRLTG